MQLKEEPLSSSLSSDLTSCAHR